LIERFTIISCQSAGRSSGLHGLDGARGGDPFVTLLSSQLPVMAAMTPPQHANAGFRGQLFQIVR
jgi:hypothetical protein